MFWFNKKKVKVGSIVSDGKHLTIVNHIFSLNGEEMYLVDNYYWSNVGSIARWCREVSSKDYYLVK